MDKLLHPNLMSTTELINVIKERQINVGNLNELSRSELLDLYKNHIMPKPQRTKNQKAHQSQEDVNSTSLAQEVKRIKLNREPSDIAAKVQRIEISVNNANKRNIVENVRNRQPHKRQRIMWP